MNLADNLKKIRKDNNLSQEQLAEQLGVSRQSVSKWESNQAYPEMDKVLQLCQLFSLNIDDLLNQDIKEVYNNKQSKNNINKFISSFLEYITKTVDMFSSMKFKEKVHLIFEELLLIGILATIFIIIGSILSNIFNSILIFLPNNLYYILYSVFENIYDIICLILGIILILHIFKVRYLDYYIIVKEDIPERELDNMEMDKLSKNSNTTPIKERPKEKIIIRDFDHSSYKFISGLLRGLLFILKVLTAFISIMFCVTLISLLICCILLFMFVETGFLFVGCLLTIIAFIIVNLGILIVQYNFIISKKNNKRKLFISFITSLFLIGIGIGLIFIGTTKFNYITDMNSKYYIEDNFIIPMNDNLIIHDYYGKINYIENNTNDIEIVTKHTSYYDVIMNNHSENIISFHTELNTDVMNVIKNSIKDINEKNIIDYSNYEIYIYTSKTNIQKLKNNIINY